MSKAGKDASKADGKGASKVDDASKGASKAVADGFEPFVKTPHMRAVVTACGHGGIAEDKAQSHTRKMTTAAKGALKHSGFGFFVFRVQGTTPCPGLAWCATGDAPSNFAQYNAEVSLLLKQRPAHQMLESGNLEGLAGTIREKIRDIDVQSLVKYAENPDDRDSHPPVLFSPSDYYKIFTPAKPPPEDHRLIATYRNPGELLRECEASAARLPRRSAIGGIHNKVFFKSYGLFFIDSTDDIDKSQWCLTSATVKTQKVKKAEYHSLEREELYNLFNERNIEAVVNMIGWRNGFLLRKETRGIVSYKPSEKKGWKDFQENEHGPVQQYLHAAFHQEVSYHDIIFIWSEGFKYDEVLFVDVACNSPSEKGDWAHSDPMEVRTAITVADERLDRTAGDYDNSDDESDSSASSAASASPHANGGPAKSPSPPPSRAKSPSPPPPPRSKSPSPPPPPSRAKGGPKKGGTRLKKRSKSYQKTSKHLKTTRKRLSRNKKNNNTRRKRYTRRR